MNKTNNAIPSLSRILLGFFAFSLWSVCVNAQYSQPSEMPPGQAPVAAAPQQQYTPPPQQMAPPPAQPQMTYAQQASIYSDPFMPGWKSSLSRHGFGVGHSPFSSDSILVFDTDPNAAKSMTYFFGFNKAADTYNEINTTTTNVIAAPNTSTTSLVKAGVRNPMVLSLGVSSNTLIYKGPFVRTRYGIYGGIDYTMPVTYGTGTYATTDPGAGTVAATETALGNVDVSYSPILRIGPTFDCFVFLRWFPNLAAGFVSGIFYSTDSTKTTTTSTDTQTYNIVNGFKQTPGAHSTAKTVRQDQYGTGISTFALGGTSFSLYTAFEIRYEW